MFYRFLSARSKLPAPTCAQGALYQLPGRILPFRTKVHRRPSKVWTAWPCRHGPKNGQKGRHQSRPSVLFWLVPTLGCDNMPLLWRSWAQSFSLPQNAPGAIFETFSPSFLTCIYSVPLLQELKDQQQNELGKTFMPYTQSNYRMHPMVIIHATILLALNWQYYFTVICRAMAGPTASRLWTRSPASSVAKMATLPTNVPRYSKKISLFLHLHWWLSMLSTQPKPE